MIGMIIVDGFETKQTIAENKKAFTEGTELVCSTLTTSYLVSKHSGWRLTGINVTNNVTIQHPTTKNGILIA